MKNRWLAAALGFFLYPVAGGYWYLNRKRRALVVTAVLWGSYWIASSIKGEDFATTVLTVYALIMTADCWRIATHDKEKMEESIREIAAAKEKKRQQVKAKFVAKQKAKGLVEYNGKWGTPEQVKKWKEIEIGLDKNFTHLSHFEFEEFIGELFRKMGYNASVTRKTGDFGIDVIAKNSKDIIAIQVKQNSPGNHVGAVTVQNVLGSMWQYKANKAVIITTSDFTVQAEQQAREAPVELWNKRLLHEMVRKYFIDK